MWTLTPSQSATVAAFVKILLKTWQIEGVKKVAKNRAIVQSWTLMTENPKFTNHNALRLQIFVNIVAMFLVCWTVSFTTTFFSTRFNFNLIKPDLYEILHQYFMMCSNSCTFIGITCVYFYVDCQWLKGWKNVRKKLTRESWRLNHKHGRTTHEAKDGSRDDSQAWQTALRKNLEPHQPKLMQHFYLMYFYASRYVLTGAALQGGKAQAMNTHNKTQP